MDGRDPLEDVMNLEHDFYQEGFDMGVEDGTHAGIVEGKLFGIEKGFEKALEMGRLQGRAKVWHNRLPSLESASSTQSAPHDLMTEQQLAETSTGGASSAPWIYPRDLSSNPRLRRHIELLLSLTDAVTLSSENSDEAVAEFDDRMLKASTKAKVISNIISEPLNLGDPSEDAKPQATSTLNIEDASKLSARH